MGGFIDELIERAFDALRCTEYSPINGKCVVFTDQQERRRYD